MITATFEQLVAHGLLQPGAHIVDGVPWSFSFHGVPVTHETDRCYLLPFGNLGNTKFEPGDQISVAAGHVVLHVKGRHGAGPTA